MRKSIDSFSKEKLNSIIKELGWPGFRSKQMFSWIFGKYVTDFSQMTNLSKSMQESLSEAYEFTTLEVLSEQVSKEQNTVKWLCELSDQAQIETVLMKHSFGNSLCISTQAGCAMNCSFCASALNGLDRNLTAGELFGQVRLAQNELSKNGAKLDHLVLMGTGEPMHNLDAVLTFLKNLHDPEGGNFSYRRVTLSTCGVIPGIERLIEEDIPINLAISLHAPNDELRSALMPVNLSYPLAKLIPAAQNYAESTGRRITYEYLLIDEMNDRKEHALELITLLRGKLASINLIPYNPVCEKPYRRSTKENIQQFHELIEKSKIPVSIRREMGKDIDAACGQLRFKSIKKEE